MKSKFRTKKISVENDNLIERIRERIALNFNAKPQELKIRNDILKISLKRFEKELNKSNMEDKGKEVIFRLKKPKSKNGLI